MEGDVRTMQDDYMEVNVINLSKCCDFLYSRTYYLDTWKRIHRYCEHAVNTSLYALRRRPASDGSQ